MNIDQNIIIDINKSALDFHISNIERVQQLCDPLKYLGITSFGYMKVFDDSRYLHICNHDIWSRYFIQNIHDTGEVLKKVLPFVDSEITSLIWPEETTDCLLRDLKNHNVFHGISFFKRTGNFIEIWSFGSEVNNPQIYEIYIKHNALLWKFVQYFQDHAVDLMDHSDSNKLAIHKNGNNIAPSKKILVEDNICKFLQAINKKQYLMRCNQNWAFISEQEKQCLEIISRGFMQSNQADLSPSIVERYLDEVKFKLGVTCKNELLDAFEHSLAHFNK